MAAIQKFSAQMIDYAERLSGMADAAEGKGVHSELTLRRWLVLPATGAALYALVRSDFFARQAREVVDEAKTRASELPDDLLSRVRQTAVQAASGNGSQRGSAKTSKPSSTRKSGSKRRAKTAGR